MYTQDAKRHVHVPGCTHRALSALFVYTALFKAPVLRYTPAKQSWLSALASNPLMYVIMQDMFRSVLGGSKQARLQQATPVAAPTGSGRRQTQQQQQQAAVPLQTQLLHA